MKGFAHTIVWIIGLCASAEAATRTTISFVEATQKCTHKTEPSTGDDDTIELTVVDSDQKPTPAKAAVVLRVVSNAEPAGATVEASTSTLAKPFAFKAVGNETIKVGGDGTSCAFILEKATDAPPVVTPPPPPPPAKQPAAAGTVDITALNERAREFLNDRRITDHEMTGGRTGRKYKLYHLPDGTPAFPIPNDISEEDQIEPWVVVVKGEKARAEVTLCKDVPAARISGTQPFKTEAVQPTKGSEAPLPPLYLLPLTAPIQCAEDLSYKITTDFGEQDVSFKVAPVYRFSWGVGYGFDFSRPTRLRLVERPVDGGMGATEHVIVQANDRSAFRPMITLTLNACNANLKRWDLCDAFGLTAMADPGRLTEGGGLGVKLQPYPGLGVLVGLTFFQVDTLAAGHAMKVGDVFAASGDLPIDKAFTSRSFGLYLGVGGDTDTVKALFGR